MKQKCDENLEKMNNFNILQNLGGFNLKLKNKGSV
jgi:hypothetical protein